MLSVEFATVMRYESETSVLQTLKSSCKKCLLDVLPLMASNRNSICDIWSHKTINSDREIVNSTSRAAVYFLFRRQPHSTSNFAHLSRKGPIGREVCNGLQSAQLDSVRKTSTWRKWKYRAYGVTAQNSLIKKGMGLQRSQHLSGVTKIQIYKSVKNVMWCFFDNTGEHFFESRDLYFFVWKYWSISGLVRKPLTVGQTLRAASGLWANISFLWTFYFFMMDFRVIFFGKYQTPLVWWLLTFNFGRPDIFLLNTRAIQS